MGNKILDIIASETNGKSYKTYKYCFDSAETSSIDYDDNNLSEECIEHVKEVAPSFVDEKSFFALKLNNEPIGCLFEKIDSWFVHFGIYTRG